MAGVYLIYITFVLKCKQTLVINFGILFRSNTIVRVFVEYSESPELHTRSQISKQGRKNHFQQVYP